jgi:hypothetical protein
MMTIVAGQNRLNQSQHRSKPQHHYLPEMVVDQTVHQFLRLTILSLPAQFF